MSGDMTPGSDLSRAWSVRRPLLTGLVAMSLLLGGFGAWAVLSELSGAVIANGRIEVDRNRQAIQHPEGGVVADLLIGEGDRVAAGDAILRFAPGQLSRDLAVASSQLFEVRVRRARLEAERDGASAITFPQALVDRAAADEELADLLRGQENLFAARVETLTRETEQLRGRITQIRAQIAGLDAQDTALAEQLALVEADLERQQGLLERGLIQFRREVPDLRPARGDARGNYGGGAAWADWGAQKVEVLPSASIGDPDLAIRANRQVPAAKEGEIRQVFRREPA